MLPTSIIGREVIFRCRDEGMLRAKVRWTRPGGRPLPIGSRDKDGRLEIPNIRVEDSGAYICEAVGYPRHVSGQQVSVQLTVEKCKYDNQLGFVGGLIILYALYTGYISMNFVVHACSLGIE